MVFLIQFDLKEKQVLPLMSFVPNTEDLRIELQYSGIDRHNYIGKEKRYHHTIIFNVIWTSEKSLDKNTTIRIAIKAMNEKNGKWPHPITDSIRKNAQFSNTLPD